MGARISPAPSDSRVSTPIEHLISRQRREARQFYEMLRRWADGTAGEKILARVTAKELLSGLREMQSGKYAYLLSGATASAAPDPETEREAQASDTPPIEPQVEACEHCGGSIRMTTKVAKFGKPFPVYTNGVWREAQRKRLKCPHCKRVTTETVYGRVVMCPTPGPRPDSVRSCSATSDLRAVDHPDPGSRIPDPELRTPDPGPDSRPRSEPRP